KERMSLATFLQEGELISVEGDNIKIEFPTEFSFYCQNLARKENENIIKKVVSQKLGREIKIIFSLKEECLVKNNLNVGNEILPSSVKKAMEIFEGRIVEEK
ncbi:MAG: hypothetical protein KAS87_05435, partial [Candidatus Omnitrophica bacterium]|nr:hypothetical protein [Candidatus Omnitrophota bacterium]